MRIKYAKIMEEVEEVIKTVGKLKVYKVPAVIGGVSCKLNMLQVRALQIIAKRRAEQSEESFKEFCNLVKISSLNEEDPIMVFRKDGCFSNDFAEGFFDVDANLLYEIL